MTTEEKARFLELGYAHKKGVLAPDYLEFIRSEFDRVWEADGPRCSQHQLLKHKTFIDLIEHPPILDFHREFFGSQIQLLQYDFLRQGPRNEYWARRWHRDFSFPGNRPLSINTILYLDDINEEVGPTYVVPGSHLEEGWPPEESRGKELPGEVATHARAGDAVFINSAIWHSGGCNTGDGLRRGIYLYYGYWWLKRYDPERVLPWQAMEDASEFRLQLLGVKMPGRDLHMYF